MATTDRRETMIALRAAHAAIRIARDVGYPAIDVHKLQCKQCGTELDWKNPTGAFYTVTCPTCGTPNELPTHLRQELPPRELWPSVDAWEAWRPPPYVRPLFWQALIFCIASMLILGMMIIYSHH